MKFSVEDEIILTKTYVHFLLISTITRWILIGGENEAYGLHAQWISSSEFSGHHAEFHVGHNTAGTPQRHSPLAWINTTQHCGGMAGAQPSICDTS